MLTQSLTRSFVYLLTCSLAHSIAPTRLDASISSLSSPGVLSPKHHTPGQQRQQQRLINAHVFSFSASNAIHSTHSRNPKTKSISPHGGILVAGVLVDWRFWFGDERLEFGVWRGGGRRGLRDCRIDRGVAGQDRQKGVSQSVSDVGRRRGLEEGEHSDGRWRLGHVGYIRARQRSEARKGVPQTGRRAGCAVRHALVFYFHLYFFHLFIFFYFLWCLLACCQVSGRGRTPGASLHWIALGTQVRLKRRRRLQHSSTALTPSRHERLLCPLFPW
ncbi:hypothetical protein JOL62DRAFT_244394 [Phyllosticta paracitricarpa]|uniref:Secreted protein n=1 Tax=Phyllosticta paracitricarpa TaxID=2016321 RepID=A0ABR1MYQ4_9PEZI